MGYELKVANGKVNFLMRTGNDKVKSSMLVAKANRLLATAKEVTEIEGEYPISVDDTYFFEGSFTVDAPVEEVEKVVKRGKR